MMMSMETDEIPNDQLDEIRKKRSLEPSAILEVTNIYTFLCKQIIIDIYICR